jgi:hypothetical protein
MGEYWHDQIRPKHFKMSAFGEYKYAKRTEKYEKRKRRKYHHNLPLVFTGKSRDLSRMKRIVATPRGVLVHMNIPALNFKRGKTRALAELAGIESGREEFERFSRLDESLVVKRFVKSLNRGLREQGQRARVKKVKLVSLGY